MKDEKVTLTLPLQFNKVSGVKGYRICVAVSSFDQWGYISEEGHSNTVIVDQNGVRINE